MYLNIAFLAFNPVLLDQVTRFQRSFPFGMKDLQVSVSRDSSSRFHDQSKTTLTEANFMYHREQN